nr:response regulator transcription factor [Pseudomaricurvus sp. HS19]
MLLVEDDATLSAALVRALRSEGFSVNDVDCGRLALEAVATAPPDLVVLDLGLPDMDGVSVLRQLRQRQASLPVLILTARDGVEDKVAALDLGADDYLAKPFEMAELLARLRVLARRLGTASSSQVQVGPVSLDTASHQVTSDGELLSLSRREYMLLLALMENSGRVLTKDALEHKLYGWGEEVASNAIEVHISNLRKKLPPQFIQTIRGVGYTVAKAPV